ncbi:MAG: 2-amino-3-carboxymuconate-6-semialdehyde decarboxylase [Bacteroidota bacterium]|nr:2-amino-3-carboxymuconate-6-semialdehyde decarboxylase [Bacteroidota bacterium]
MKIDIHTHIIPENLPRWSEKFGYGGFIHLEHHKPCCARMMKDDEFFREIQSNCWDPATRIEECNHSHVDVQVISTIPVMFNYWARPDDCLDISRFLNDHIAEVVERYPKKFIGLGTIPMQSAELAIREMERCKKLGLAGIQIGTNINDINLNEPRFFPIYQAAEALGMAIFVHPWNMMGAKQMSKYWLPWLVGMPAETNRAICSIIFGGVFERFPKLRFAFAHGGGSFPANLGRIERGFDVRPDLTAIDNAISPRKYLGHFYVDSLMHDELFLKYVIDLLGEDKVCLGTDYPFPLGESVPGEEIDRLKLSKKSKDKLLYQNALNWLNLDKKNFLVK